MSDLISKTDAIIALLSKGQNSRRYKLGETWELNLAEIKDAINNMPSSDAVEVVRCRECEYWKCNPNTKNYGVCKKVSYDDFEVVMDGDDFCSYAERRQDGEEDE